MINSGIYNNRRNGINLGDSFRRGLSIGQAIKESRIRDEERGNKKAIKDLFKKAIETGESVSISEIAQYSPEMAHKMQIEKTKAAQVAEQEKLNNQVRRMQIKKMRREEAESSKPFEETRAGKKAAFMNKLKKESKQNQKLSAKDVMNVNEGNQIPQMLDGLEKTLNVKENRNNMGPIEGTLRSYWPWDDRTKVLEADIRSKAQAFGRFMEGGVLRKEDEEKYTKMFPNVSDTPEQASAKLDIVRKLLVEKQNSNINALRNSGYDVSALDKGFKVPEAPAILKGDKKEKPLMLQAVDKVVSPAQAADPVTVIREKIKNSSREEKEKFLKGF